MTQDEVAVWMFVFGNQPVFYRKIRDLFGETYTSWVAQRYLGEASRPKNAVFEEWVFYELQPKALALLK